MVLQKAEGKYDVVVKLPAPAGWQMPDVDIKAPGYSYMPPISPEIEISENAPHIYEYTPDAGPDETFFVVGDKLTDDIYLWGVSPINPGGQLWQAKVQFVEDNYMAVTIPQQAQNGSFLAWVHNADGWSRPIRLNTPQLWWCNPNKIVAGSSIRIFGRNLARRPDYTTAFVYLKQPGKIGQWLKVEQAGKYSLTVYIPKELMPGNYELWVHAGWGGSFTWGGPLALTVQLKETEVLQEFIVPSREDVDLQSILDNVAKQGGGMVRLGEGTFEIDNTLCIPPNVTLTGVGKEATRLQMIYSHSENLWKCKFPIPGWSLGEAMTFAGYSSAARQIIEDTPYYIELGTAVVWLSGDGAAVQDLTISGSPQVNMGIVACSEDATTWLNCCKIRRVRITNIDGKQSENCGIRLIKAAYAIVEDNEIYGRTPIFLSGIQQSQIIGNRIVSVSLGGGNGLGAIQSRCEMVKECIIEDNKIACPTDGEAGCPTTMRMIWLSSGRGSVSHNWIAGNGIEPTIRPGATNGANQARFGNVAGFEQNVGETLAFEGNLRIMYFGTLSGADIQSVTLPKTITPTLDDRFGSMVNGGPVAVRRDLLAYDTDGNETPFWPPDDDDGGPEPPLDQYYVSIFKGPGQGQTRRVVRREGTKLIVDRPWNHIPEKSSTVVIETSFYQNLMVGNYTPDGCTGLQFWISTIENVIAGNTVERERREGIFLFGNATTLASSMPRCWNRGISPLFFNHVESNYTEQCKEGILVTTGERGLPVEFPRALGNMLRHNSFVNSRLDGVLIAGRGTAATAQQPAIAGTIVEFNVVRDAPVAYHLGFDSDYAVLRRNHAYFWYPVNNTQEVPVAFQIDKPNATVILEDNNSEDKVGIESSNFIKVKYMGRPQ